MPHVLTCRVQGHRYYIGEGVFVAVCPGEERVTASYNDVSSCIISTDLS